MYEPTPSDDSREEPDNTNRDEPIREDALGNLGEFFESLDDERRKVLHSSSSNFQGPMLPSIALCNQPLHETQREFLYDNICSSEDLETVMASLIAYLSHIEHYGRTRGIIIADQTHKDINWNKIANSEDSAYFIATIYKVSQAMLNRRPPVFHPQLLPLLTEISHGLVRTEPELEEVSYALCAALTILSTFSIDLPHRSHHRWDKAYEVLLTLSEKCINENNGKFKAQDRIITATLCQLVTNSPSHMPYWLIHSSAALLDKIARNDKVGFQKEEIGMLIGQHLVRLMSEPTKPTRKQSDFRLGYFSFQYPGSQLSDISSHRRDAIINYLGPHYKPELAEVDTLTSSLRNAKEQEAAKTISKLCAIYIYSECVPGGDATTKKRAILALAHQAENNESPNIRALSKLYIYKLYSSSLSDKDVNTAFAKSFSFENLTKDEASTKCSIAVARELLAEKMDHTLLSVVESIAKNSPTKELKKLAIATLCSVQIREDLRPLRTTLQTLSEDPDLANERETIQRIAITPSRESLLQEFEKTALKKFGNRLKEADPNIALYNVIQKIDEIKLSNDATRQFRNFTSAYDNPFVSTIRVHIHQIEDPKILAQAWKEFCEDFRSFADKHGLHPLFLGRDHQGIDIEKDPFARLNLFPVMLDLAPSLHECMLWRHGPRVRNEELWYAHTVVEPKHDFQLAATHLCGADGQVLETKMGLSYKESYEILKHYLINHEKFEVEDYSKILEIFENVFSKFNAARGHVSLTLTQAKILDILDESTRKKLLEIVSQNGKLHELEYAQEVDKILCNLFRNANSMVKTLGCIESEEVVYAEIKRSIELLLLVRKTGESQDFHLIADFRDRPYLGLITYLPRNEPLFSVINEVLLPSLIHKSAYIRSPDCYEQDNILRNIVKKLGVARYASKDPAIEAVCDNIEISFRRDESEDRFISRVAETTDTIIYAGTKREAKRKLAEYTRMNNNNELPLFGRTTSEDTSIFLIGGGSGHNPIIIAQSCSLDFAVPEVIDAVVKNSGQDCTSPCSILVEGGKEREERFLRLLSQHLNTVSVGRYKDWSPTPIRVGQLSSAKPEDWKNLRDFIYEYRADIYIGESPHTTIIREGEEIVNPTIFRIPLENGPNFKNTFAPLFLVQRFHGVEQLKTEFFKNKQYMENAMYVSLYTDNEEEHQRYRKMIQGLRYKKDGESLSHSDDENDKQLHPDNTILLNCSLNSPDVDRGDIAFGGYGTSTTFLLDELGNFVAKPLFLLNATRFGFDDVEISS